VSDVERITGASFPPPLSVQTVVQEPVQVKAERRPTPDDVGTIDADQIADAKQRIDQLTPPESEWLTGIVKACRLANYPINLTGAGGIASARRHAIILALIALAPYFDDLVLEAAVLDARGEQRNADISIGALVGSMTLTEAHQVISTADNLRTGASHLVYDYDTVDIVETKTPKTPKDRQP